MDSCPSYTAAFTFPVLGHVDTFSPFSCSHSRYELVEPPHTVTSTAGYDSVTVPLGGGRTPFWTTSITSPLRRRG
ncbi:hypothetical protein BDM02DRAFT_3124969 [Thelephora ganbajun]|uniref:Uncharacterized protein n=1 Tax=Thelephora ganbajun TaxID=370292 RepID=A0ACB6YX18_THEGA|nr:hypothetical protein BDM02DRAFT_3124969 [Thelephora ganbajun]